jgi:hypothetical protein
MITLLRRRAPGQRPAPSARPRGRAHRPTCRLFPADAIRAPGTGNALCADADRRSHRAGPRGRCELPRDAAQTLPRFSDRDRSREPAARTTRTAVVGAHRGRGGRPRADRPQPAAVPVTACLLGEGRDGSHAHVTPAASSRMGTQAVHGDPDEPVNGLLGRQAARSGQRVEAVGRQLAGCDVVSKLAFPGYIGQQLREQLDELLLCPSSRAPAVRLLAHRSHVMPTLAPEAAHRMGTRLLTGKAILQPQIAARDDSGRPPEGERPGHTGGAERTRTPDPHTARPS